MLDLLVFVCLIIIYFQIKLGTCYCAPGFRGVSCNDTCPEGFFGQDCELNCNCLNGASCSPETGQCFCAPGWKRQKCDRPCDEGYFGKDCAQKCNCLNNGSCSQTNGNYIL